jgi:hypothetical protein
MLKFMFYSSNTHVLEKAVNVHGAVHILFLSESELYACSPLGICPFQHIVPADIPARTTLEASVDGERDNTIFRHGVKTGRAHPDGHRQTRVLLPPGLDADMGAPAWFEDVKSEFCLE